MSGGAEPVEAAWARVSADAVVGTGRREPRDVALRGRAGELLRRVQAGQRSPEGAFLASVAMLWPWSMAGRIPAREVGQALEPAPVDAPECGGAAARLLRDIVVGGRFPRLLTLWCELAVKKGVRVPDHLIPAVMRQAPSASARPLLRQALGARGRWLAEHNAAWALWLSGDGLSADAAGTWEAGSREARLDLLRLTRDVDPAAGRALLARGRGLAGEAAADRVALIGCLERRLGPADEALLEACLDDRAKTVRARAAALLACLPGSALCDRMAARARPLLRLRRKGLVFSRDELDVTLPDPDALDAAARRDGLGVDPAPGAGQGRRAALLAQLLSATPLPRVAEALGREADALVRLALRTDQAAPLIRGWTVAAGRQRDPVWALALLEEHWLRRELTAGGVREVASLAGLLASERRGQVIEAVLQRAPVPIDSDLAETLRTALGEGPWDASVSRSVVGLLHRHAAAGHPLGAPLRELGMMLHPDLLNELADLAVGREPLSARGVDFFHSLAAVLDFRRRLYEELS